MSDEKFPKKSYCYKYICQVVRSGFHLEDYPVCTICKLEITESLFQRIKERDIKEEDLDVNSL